MRSEDGPPEQPGSPQPPEGSADSEPIDGEESGTPTGILIQHVESVLPHTPAAPREIPQPAADGSRDLELPGYYLNRELTLLNFYFRVLHEAEDPRTPLLERLKFAAIVSSNIDDFIMKRVGGLRQQVGAGVHGLTVDGRTPEQQIAACAELIRELDARLRDAIQAIELQLADHGVRRLRPDELDDARRKELRRRYVREIHPLVTPQATDPAHPFPFISNLSLNLVVTLRDPNSAEVSMARVKIPVGSGMPRFVQLEGTYEFVALEDLMIDNLDLLFPGMLVESCSLFRVTRNANTERSEESADDLLAMIESELRERKFAPVVRLEVDEEIDALHLRLLKSELKLDPLDVYEKTGLHGLRDLMEIAGVDLPDLKDPPHHPVDHPLIKPDRSIFQIIRDARSLLVIHPYESFSGSVERFLAEASEDSRVRAIKMTLYRTSEESKAVDYLIKAARNGKQVAVAVELKASFDEAANIRFANRLEEVGIHVTYGVVGLKTHCKTILVVREDEDGLRRYAHIGTGNYHAGTARHYSDVGLLTADRKIGEDLTELFNYLTTGFKPKRKFRKLLPAPKILKPALISKIRREVDHQRQGEPGRIQMKMNALEDPDITMALYEAARDGVAVDLIIRDTCRLRPGIEGLSERIRVVSVLGRFLEHARIYYFNNGGDEEYYIGSADCMSRNLHARVEALAPVEDPALQEELRFLLDTQLADRRGGWEMRADGSYVLRSPITDLEAVSSQVTFIEEADRRLREARRLRRRGTRSLRSRNTR